mgnify:CR=1 FL=1
MLPVAPVQNPCVTYFKIDWGRYADRPVDLNIPWIVLLDLTGKLTTDFQFADIFEVGVATVPV